MSTGILYHCFGITGRGIHYVHTRFEQGQTVFRIGQDPTTFRCSACGSRKVMKKGTVFRRFRTLPIGLRPTIIEFPVQRVLCLACGLTRQIPIGFAEPGRRYTKRFERYVLELSRHMTMTDVARHVGIDWHTVKEIQKKHLSRNFSRPSLGGLKWIAVVPFLFSILYAPTRRPILELTKFFFMRQCYYSLHGELPEESCARTHEHCEGTRG